eukprot:3905304-Pyramimonas_sp.AAC.1
MYPLVSDGLQSLRGRSQSMGSLLSVYIVTIRSPRMRATTRLLQWQYRPGGMGNDTLYAIAARCVLRAARISGHLVSCISHSGGKGDDDPVAGLPADSPARVGQWSGVVLQE